MEKWFPGYDSVSRLDERSLFLIRSRLRRFLEGFGDRPLTWPVDCFSLVRDLCFTHHLRIGILESSAFSPAFEAATAYDPETGSYLIVMRAAPENWPSRSKDRRCNFTVAHELGHVFLGHLEIPDGRKSKAWRAREDAEADEFASRLLMPEALMRQARFPSLPAMAAAFLVSEQACFHRLNNLRLLERANLGPAVCPACGNRRISPCASWCRMCGAAVGPRIPDETAMMLRLPQPARCPVCGSDVRAYGGDCPDCGHPRNNPCQPEYDQPRHPNPPDARYCEVCGAETLYAQLMRTPEITRDMDLWKTFRETGGGG